GALLPRRLRSAPAGLLHHGLGPVDGRHRHDRGGGGRDLAGAGPAHPGQLSARTGGAQLSSVTIRTTRAGGPSTRAPVGTSRVTTDAAATTASSPMLTPGRIVTL